MKTYTIAGKEFTNESTGGGCTALMHTIKKSETLWIELVITDGDMNAPLTDSEPVEFFVTIVTNPNTSDYCNDSFMCITADNIQELSNIITSISF